MGTYIHKDRVRTEMSAYIHGVPVVCKSFCYSSKANTVKSPIPGIYTQPQERLRKYVYGIERIATFISESSKSSG